MGMFDIFYFAEGILPDNRELPEKEFQTKDMQCNLDKYQVDKFGWVKCDEDAESEITDTAVVYSHDFDHEPVRTQYYKIQILNNKIVYAKKISENGYDK